MQEVYRDQQHGDRDRGRSRMGQRSRKVDCDGLGPECSSLGCLSWGKRVGPLFPALTSHWMQLAMVGQGLGQGAPLSAREGIHLGPSSLNTSIRGRSAPA